ncbi:hypothetical protein C8J57DRAFT_1580266 [Mycena rebaudengoi]|nr:hypothetical protein C8J57DRAFT_1580266 [Mycena rebaudengoi]
MKWLEFENSYTAQQNMNLRGIRPGAAQRRKMQQEKIALEHASPAAQRRNFRLFGLEMRRAAQWKKNMQREKNSHRQTSAAQRKKNGESLNWDGGGRARSRPRRVGDVVLERADSAASVWRCALKSHRDAEKPAAGSRNIDFFLKKKEGGATRCRRIEDVAQERGESDTNKRRWGAKPRLKKARTRRPGRDSERNKARWGRRIGARGLGRELTALGAAKASQHRGAGRGAAKKPI